MEKYRRLAGEMSSQEVTEADQEILERELSADMFKILSMYRLSRADISRITDIMVCRLRTAKREVKTMPDFANHI